MAYLRRLVEMAREEDLRGAGLNHPPAGGTDVSSAILQCSRSGTSVLRAREGLVVCGLPVVPVVLQAYHEQLSFHPLKQDGDSIQAGEILGRIEGPVREMLMAERVLLNFLQFLSGVASETARYAAVLAESATRLLDTRKTTPGYRMLQKYAVARGGGWNHRLGLFDRVMLKDNHLAADGAQADRALTLLVERARRHNPRLLIEVEVDHLAQIPAVVKAGADKVMLDNFSNDDLQAAVDLIGGDCCTEATGNITLDKLPALARTGLDFVSTGALVHQSVWKDIGLDWS